MPVAESVLREKGLAVGRRDIDFEWQGPARLDLGRLGHGCGVWGGCCGAKSFVSHLRIGGKGVGQWLREWEVKERLEKLVHT